MKIQFITASHNKRVLDDNLTRSPIFKTYSLHVMLDYDNIPKAYNEAQKMCKADIYVFVHHDVYLPASFEKNLLASLDQSPADFGVLGVAGVILNGSKKNYGFILDRKKLWSFGLLPAVVDTLDEMLIITHGDFLFDENLPLDFYGADLCLEAKKQGRKNYAISAFCHHNSTRPIGGRTESFYESEKYFREKWREALPVATTCSIVQ